MNAMVAQPGGVQTAVGWPQMLRCGQRACRSRQESRVKVVDGSESSQQMHPVTGLTEAGELGRLHASLPEIGLTPCLGSRHLPAFMLHMYQFPCYVHL
jgi:hypothetical protein